MIFTITLLLISKETTNEYIRIDITTTFEYIFTKWNVIHRRSKTANQLENKIISISIYIYINSIVIFTHK